MFNAIVLKDFQSHELSELIFDKGVTVITGSSNQGKTSILRALNWVVNNRPRGAGIIRRGKDCCEVSLSIDDKIIRRVRSKNENCYYLTVDGEEIRFEALGGNVPEEIVSILNMKDINIQEQLASYFLVLETPGKVGTYINSITKLDEIDQIIFEISRLIRTENVTQTELMDKLCHVENEEKIYQDIDLDDFERDVEKHNVFIKNKEKLDLEIVSLEDMIVNIDEVEDELEAISLPENTIQLIEDGSFLSKKVRDLEDKIQYLKTLVEDCSDYIFELLSIKDVDFSILDTVVEHKNKAISLNDDVRSLRNVILTIEADNRDAESYKELIEKLNDEIVYIMENDLTICPYCNQELNNDTKKVLLERAS